MMSDVETAMNLEALPNEILIECFEYLNADDIFYSFDFLNSRLHNLIRNSPLHLRIEGMKEARLVEFCCKIALNPQIKQQIKSLTLSKLMPHDIEKLSLFVQFEEFSQLQVLTVDYLPEHLVSRLSSMLPLLTNLRYFSINDIRAAIHPILLSLPNTTLKSLSIQMFPENIALEHPVVSLVNLVISRCTVNIIYRLFEYSPSLRYLEIENFIGYLLRTTYALSLQNRQLIHLTRLIVHKLLDKFESFEIILKRTPNLKVLIISIGSNPNLIDAPRWEHLIATSLPLLKTFKFTYRFKLGIYNHDIVNKFERFQTDFWIHQHHWYTEYVFQKDIAVIYTVPYASNKCEITPHTRRYYNEFTNNRNTFANVTTLQLSLNKTMVSSEYYFPNLESLILKIIDVDDSSKTKQMQCLKTMINLSNLTHLEIQSNWQLMPLIQLVNEAPYLSSIKVNKVFLIQMLNYQELCECFDKMIKKLDTIDGSWSFFNFEEISKVCQVFSNLENFRCYITETDNLQMIVNQLSQLTYMKKFSFITLFYDIQKSWLNLNQFKTNSYAFTIKCDDDD